MFPSLWKGLLYDLAAPSKAMKGCVSCCQYVGTVHYVKIFRLIVRSVIITRHMIILPCYMTRPLSNFSVYQIQEQCITLRES